MRESVREVCVRKNPVLDSVCIGYFYVFVSHTYFTHALTHSLARSLAHSLAHGPGAQAGAFIPLALHHILHNMSLHYVYAMFHHDLYTYT